MLASCTHGIQSQPLVLCSSFSGCYGKVYALSGTGNNLGFIIGPIVATAVEQALGFGTNWLIFGVILMAFCIPLGITLALEKRNKTAVKLTEVKEQVQEVNMSETEAGKVAHQEPLPVEDDTKT